MATRLKKKNNPAKKPSKPKSSGSASKGFTAEKEEKIDWKELARDERTWKIVGTIFILIAIFLFISFVSYLFTWAEDQDVANKGLSALFDNTLKARNLLGRLGALISHFFINYGFGIASFLICTFFFVVGVNLLFRRKVFSIWRNLKYVTVGLLVLSVSMAFIFGRSGFPWGGAVGDMISDKLIGTLGNVGTAAVLLLMAGGYFIWQFNPSFNWPAQKEEIAAEDGDESDTEEQTEEQNTAATIINPLTATTEKSGTGNSLTTADGIVINFPEEKTLPEFQLIEKEEPIETVIEKMSADQTSPEKEIVNEILHTHEEMNTGTDATELEIPEPVKQKPSGRKTDEPLELEIKTMPEKVVEEPTVAENLPPYEPTLDLSNYKYPSLSLLETHGSEKIIQDTSELENHKNQIIATLRNYSIEIQKISATVGPTVTLYEIVPAPGVRISRIKNLEDDIALSLAALGIRIIAPIPGKGTIGIEVPNVRKTVVSMKTLLSSEKFQNNTYSLPIAIGKKID
ncbi:MAG TPA: DNA translocase FtsK 4TM domain-containing protein, partial [Chitinophagaceae bacterium]|nr:DNA translocase FtsK 4TM domain-containing protein [Chitinophagaceae bacterium]